MDTFNYLIVRVEDAYSGTVETTSGIKFYETVMLNNTSQINREAEVVSVPKGVILNEGDKVIIHHNICRKRLSTSGEEIPSDYYIEDNLYFVPLSEVFLYKRGSKWKALAPYTFVEPIKADSVKSENLIIPEHFYENAHEGNKHLYGILKYSNEQLEYFGAKEGDTVIFDKDSEYKFEIDGEVLYKMSTKDILATVV